MRVHLLVTVCLVALLSILPSGTDAKRGGLSLDTKQADESPCGSIDHTSLTLFKATRNTNYNKADILLGHNNTKTSRKERVDVTFVWCRRDIPVHGNNFPTSGLILYQTLPLLLLTEYTDSQVTSPGYLIWYYKKFIDASRYRLNDSLPVHPAIVVSHAKRSHFLLRST
jgi:hypothetical protein